MTEAEAAADQVRTTRPPRHWEADVLLRDGRTAHIRPIQPEDRALLVEFYSRVSDQSKYYRFFSPMPELSERDLDRFTQVDHRDRVAFVMLLGGSMIAVGRYDVVEPGQAEVAFLVEDKHQGRGIGQQLLNMALDFCRQAGFKRVYLTTFAGLDAARHLYERAGFKLYEEVEDRHWGEPLLEQKFELWLK